MTERPPAWCEHAVGHSQQVDLGHVRVDPVLAGSTGELGEVSPENPPGPHPPQLLKWKDSLDLRPACGEDLDW